MRTTADPREAFRQIDATEINSDSYEFKIAEKDLGPASVVPEGEEIAEQSLDFESKTVHFQDVSSEAGIKQLAVEELRSSAEARVAGSPIENDFSYMMLFIDRERGESYIIDTSRFGYELVRSKDENGEPARVAFSAIKPEAALRIR